MKKSLKNRKEVLVEQIHILTEMVDDIKTHKSFDDKIVQALELIIKIAKEK